MPEIDSPAKQFWAQVSICKHGRRCKHCCWEWAGPRHPQGYGQTYFKGRSVQAHRLALILHKHAWLFSKTFVVMHTCDNPPCCNFHHLIIGSHADNSQDAQRKGRLGRKRKREDKIETVGLASYEKIAKLPMPKFEEFRNCHKNLRNRFVCAKLEDGRPLIRADPNAWRCYIFWAIANKYIPQHQIASCLAEFHTLEINYYYRTSGA